MMIFPDLTVTDIEASAETADYVKDIAFDFASNSFKLQDGKPIILEGVDALKQWIEKALRTARYRWPAYTWDYGSEIEDIIGLDLSNEILESELKRAIKETLLINQFINGVYDFKVTRNGSIRNISFTVDTTLDDTFTQEVNI